MSTEQPHSGFNNALHLEHIASLADEGYAVYFGEVESSEQYYALLIPRDEHQEQIHTLNQIHYAAFLVRKAHCDMPWMFDEKFEPLRRFAAESVLEHSNVRVSDTAWNALTEANKALDDPRVNLPC